RIVHQGDALVTPARTLHARMTDGVAHYPAALAECRGSRVAEVVEKNSVVGREPRTTFQQAHQCRRCHMHPCISHTDQSITNISPLYYQFCRNGVNVRYGAIL